MNFYAQAVAVFVSFAVLDVAWAKYMVSAAQQRVGSAMFWSSAITLLAGFVTVEYVDNNWMLIPATMGGMLGTWIGMRK